MTADEFVLVMAILGQCKIADTVSGQQQLVDLVGEQCNLNQPFNPVDQEHLDRIIICIKHALPYFSVKYDSASFNPATISSFSFVLQTQVKSTTFVSYICDQVLPHRSQIAQIDGNEQKFTSCWPS